MPPHLRVAASIPGEGGVKPCATLAGMCIHLLLARIMNAYRVFADENRAAAKAQLQAEGQGAGMGQVAKILGAQWRALDEEAKKVYLDKAAAAAEVKVRACVRVCVRLTALNTKAHPNFRLQPLRQPLLLPQTAELHRRQKTRACAAACIPPALWSWGVAHSLHPPTSGKEGDGPVLPVSRVKRICRLDGDVRQVSGDAVRLVAQATVRALRESWTTLFWRSSCQSSAFRKLTSTCATGALHSITHSGRVHRRGVKQAPKCALRRRRCVPSCSVVSHVELLSVGDLLCLTAPIHVCQSNM